MQNLESPALSYFQVCVTVCVCVCSQRGEGFNQGFVFLRRRHVGEFTKSLAFDYQPPGFLLANGIRPSCISRANIQKSQIKRRRRRRKVCFSLSYTVEGIIKMKLVLLFAALFLFSSFKPVIPISIAAWAGNGWFRLLQSGSILMNKLFFFFLFSWPFYWRGEI